MRSPGFPLVVTPEGTLRYATLASPTLRAAYDQAIVRDQLADIHQRHADAQQRGWADETKRHSRVIDALETHCHRLVNRPVPASSP